MVIKNVSFFISVKLTEYRQSHISFCCLYMTNGIYTCKALFQDFDNQYGSNINQSRDLKSRTSSVQSGTSSVGFRQVFTDVAIFQGEIVALKYSSLKKVRADRNFLLQMKCVSVFFNVIRGVFKYECTQAHTIFRVHWVFLYC
jgi:hypothetical protein